MQCPAWLRAKFDGHPRALQLAQKLFDCGVSPVVIAETAAVLVRSDRQDVRPASNQNAPVTNRHGQLPSVSAAVSGASPKNTPLTRDQIERAWTQAVDAVNRLYGVAPESSAPARSSAGNRKPTVNEPISELWDRAFAEAQRTGIGGYVLLCEDGETHYGRTADHY